MIVAEQKPIAEIDRLLEGAKKVLIVGCRECVTVCQAGGEKEVNTMASALRLLWATSGRNPGAEILTETLERQCEPEYIEQIVKVAGEVDAILSLACGVGVQYLAERYPVWVVPGLNTKFAGGALEQGVWTEKCGLCGDCILYKTGGICPVIRCSKSILNGPCGGSHNGKCEVNEETDCALQLIYDRMTKLGKVDRLLEIEPPKDWSKSRDGGPRKVVKEEIRI